MRPPHRFPSSAGALLRATVLAGLAGALTPNLGRSTPVEMSAQSIMVPLIAVEPLFMDVDGDGRADLFVLDPPAQKLLIYRQRGIGFTNAPDQIVELPPATGWVGLGDVEEASGLELLFSTATGVSYCRQAAGRYEATLRELVTAGQVFTNSQPALLGLVETNRTGSPRSLPIIAAAQSRHYHRGEDGTWRLEPPVNLGPVPAEWSVRRSQTWSVGSHRPAYWAIEQSRLERPAEARELEPENEGIRGLMADLKQNSGRGRPGTIRIDVDGDGREDLVLWSMHGKLDFKTELYVFLRDANLKLLERPNQVLRCRGFPIPVRSTQLESPVGDVDGDGVCELLLLEFKGNLMTPGGLVDMVLSHGLELGLTIRTFKNGGFAGNPVASFPIKAILPSDELEIWPFCIAGDFNGDHRPDLLVQRSDTHWYIYFSTTDGRWFRPEPGLTFRAPLRGYPEIVDLNGDGRSDVVWHEPESGQLTIFLTPTQTAKDRNP